MCEAHQDEEDSLFDFLNYSGELTDEGDIIYCIECIKFFKNERSYEDGNKQIALHLICHYIIVDNLEEILEILSHDVDINHQDILGETPLHILARRCLCTTNGGPSNFRFWTKKTTLLFLLNNRADLYIADFSSNKRTPYDIFMECGDQEIKNIVLSYSTLDIKEPDIDG